MSAEGYVVRKLRERPDGSAVYGVRLMVHCGCGMQFYQTFVVGVNHPYIHCPRCRARSRQALTWRLSGPVREGTRLQLRQGVVSRRG